MKKDTSAYVKQIDSEIDVKTNGAITDGIQFHGINHAGVDKYDGTPKLISVKRTSLSGIENSAYNDDGEGVFHGTIEIIKELPALHIERCKL